MDLKKSPPNEFTEASQRQSNGNSSLYEVPMTDDEEEEDGLKVEQHSFTYEADLSVWEEHDVDHRRSEHSTEPVVPEPPRAPPTPGRTAQRVLLDPDAVRVTKGGATAEPTEPGPHRPGAYQIQGRAFGAIPVWARVRHASQRIQSLRSARFDVDNEATGPTPSAQGSSQPNAADGRLPEEHIIVADVAPHSLPLNEDDDIKKNKKFRVYCWSAIIGVLVLGAVAAGVGVALRNSVSNSPAPKNAKCDFIGQSQPDIMQQCMCFESVNIISPQVASSYHGLVTNYVLHLPPSYSEPISSCSPVNQALLWLAVENSTGMSDSELRLLNRFVLTVLFIVWGGPMWKQNESWLTHDNECTWYGVTCDHQVITGISLSDNNFASESSIPTELFLLTGLDSLFLANNALTGNVSSTIGGLRNLEILSLKGNNFTSSFPFKAITSLAKLRVMDISDFHFSGKLPAAIGNLTSLEELIAENNSLSGSLPTELGLMTNLIVLVFSHTVLTGTLPTEIGKLTKLELFAIDGLFDGVLPTEIAQMTNLRYLSISGSVESEIPTQLGGLSELVSLELSNALLNGPIPATLGMLTSLTNLVIQGGYLTGTIPSELSLLPRLVFIDLSLNLLEGSIPQDLFWNTNLHILILAQNRFHGKIPTDVENATKLACMDLTMNELTGPIPSSLCGLPDIKKIAVDCSLKKGCPCCTCAGSSVCTSGAFKAKPNFVANFNVTFP